MACELLQPSKSRPSNQVIRRQSGSASCAKMVDVVRQGRAINHNPVTVERPQDSVRGEMVQKMGNPHGGDKRYNLQISY